MKVLGSHYQLRVWCQVFVHCALPSLTSTKSSMPSGMKSTRWRVRLLTIDSSLWSVLLSALRRSVCCLSFSLESLLLKCSVDNLRVMSDKLDISCVSSSLTFTTSMLLMLPVINAAYQSTQWSVLSCCRIMLGLECLRFWTTRLFETPTASL